MRHAAGLGLSTPEMVTTHEETVRLAADYNHELAAGKQPVRSQFQLFPAFAPEYAGLAARLTF